MRKWHYPFLALLMTCLALAPIAHAETILNMGTGGTSGTYAPLGGDLAILFSLLPDIDVHPVATGGSKDNVDLIERGDTELGLVQNDIAAFAYAGSDAFEGQQT